MEGDAPRLLPVCQTVVESYRATFANWRYALRISWAWFVPILALDLLIEILPENPPTRGIPIGTGFLMLYSIPLSSLAVAWHRKLLRTLTGASRTPCIAKTQYKDDRPRRGEAGGRQ